MNTKIIKLDINKRLYEKITAKQGDTKSRFLLFHLLDGAVQFSLVGRTVRVYGLKPDNKEFFNDLQIVDVNKGYCKLELTSQALAVPGDLDLELVIMEGESKLSSIPFVVEVIKSLNSKSAIESSNEYKALDRSLTKVEEWNNEFADKSGKLEQLYTERLNGLGTQLDEKAKQVDLDVERKRIDNLIIVGDGTQNLETADIRVGADGKIYTSAGEAVRGQISAIARTNISSNINDNTKAVNGFFYNTNGSLQGNSEYCYSSHVPVKVGDVVRFLSDTTINQKAITFFDNENKYVYQTTNSSGAHPATRKEWKRLDGGQKIIYVCEHEVTDSRVKSLVFSYAIQLKNKADMLTINANMPIDYEEFNKILSVSMSDKLIGTHKNISDFNEAIKNVSNLSGVKIGFLGDSFTDVSNYYGKKIADRTGCIAFNYGKQGSRIINDNTVSGNIVKSFISRVKAMADDLDCVVIFGGINDASGTRFFTTDYGTIDDSPLTQEQVLNEIEPSTWYSAMKTLIETVMYKFPQKKILLVIPPHVLNESYAPSITAYRGIDKIVKAEREVAELYGIKVCDLYKECQELNNFSGNVATYRIGNSNDIHPNDLGQDAMSILIQKSVEDMFL